MQCLVRYILEHSRYLVLTTFLSQQQVLNRLQTLVDEMIPCTRVTVHHCWGFDVLLPVRLAPLALEGVVGVARRLTMVLEKFPETVKGKMTLDIFGGVHNARG